MTEITDTYYTNKKEQYKVDLLERVVMNHIIGEEKPYNVHSGNIETHGGKANKAGRYLIQLGFVKETVVEYYTVSRRVNYGYYSSYIGTETKERIIYVVDETWFNSLKESFDQAIEFEVLHVDNKDRAEYKNPLHRSYKPFNRMSCDELCTYHFFPERFDVIDKPMHRTLHSRQGAKDEFYTLPACFPKHQIEEASWDSIIIEMYNLIFEDSSKVQFYLPLFGDITLEEAERFVKGFDLRMVFNYYTVGTFCSTVEESVEEHLNIVHDYLRVVGKVKSTYGEKVYNTIPYLVLKKLFQTDSYAEFPKDFVPENVLESAKKLGVNKWDRFIEDAPLLLNHKNDFVQDFVQRTLRGD